jgi:hypothetical protein
VSARPHLVRWEAEYAACGLAVIEVSGGAAVGFANSRRRLAKWDIRDPVLWDAGNANAKAYAVTGWPSAFLIGPDGRVFWQGNPATLNDDRDAELAFRERLEQQLLRSETGSK